MPVHQFNFCIGFLPLRNPYLSTTCWRGITSYSLAGPFLPASLPYVPINQPFFAVDATQWWYHCPPKQTGQPAKHPDVSNPKAEKGNNSWPNKFILFVELLTIGLIF